jgi:hypothetical protein
MKQFNAETGNDISMIIVSTHESRFTEIFGKYDLETSTKRDVLVVSQQVIACRLGYVTGNRTPWGELVQKRCTEAAGKQLVVENTRTASVILQLLISNKRGSRRHMYL